MLSAETDFIGNLKAHFSPETIERISKTFGPLGILENAKIILPTIIAAPNKDDTEELHMINMTKEVPFFIEDWFHFHFLRSYSRSSILSAKTIRDEENTRGIIQYDFKQHKDLTDFFYYGTETPRDQERPKRPFFILSKQMDKDELLSYKFYQHSYAKLYVMKTEKLKEALNNKDPELLAFVKERGVEFVDESVIDIADATKYLLNQKLSNVLIEAGTTSYEHLIEDPELEAPADVISLTLFTGKTGTSWIGKKHTPFSTILKKYNLVFKSEEFTQNEGSLRFYTFVKKSKSEKESATVHKEEI